MMIFTGDTSYDLAMFSYMDGAKNGEVEGIQAQAGK